MGAVIFSVIQTPPPNRYPIQTEVHTFNEDIITEAINFEMSRNGQVSLSITASESGRIGSHDQAEYTDCRVCIGHGQMEPEKLEKIIFDFVNYDYDVLLATTIIESGIDIPNANTIIINQAQNFGLSELAPGCADVWGGAIKKLSVTCWHRLCPPLLPKQNDACKPSRTSPTWAVASTLPCRTLTSVAQAICSVPNRVVSLPT